MAKKRVQTSDSSGELLKDILIVELGMAGVRQQAIRQIVGCDIKKVNRIVKHIIAARKKDTD